MQSASRKPASKPKKNKNKNKNKQKKPLQNPEYKAPVATTRVVRIPDPRINRSAKNGDVVVEHSEFLSDIVGSTAFTVRKFAINAGLFQTFPWLSAMANLYESYKLERLDFEFQTEAATSAVGSVMGVVDYDPADPAPVSKMQMAAYRGYMRSAPWKSFTQRSSREDISKRKSYFTRNGPIPVNQDLQLYDTGNFFLATERQANDTDVVGELYVHYRIRLMTPQLGNPAVGNALSAYYVVGGDGPSANAGSNAPLEITGTIAGVTLTAIAPYDCVLALTGASSPAAAITLSTTGSTATIQNAQVNVVSGLTSYTAQLSFQPGQTLVLTPSASFTGAINISVGQFNTQIL